MNATEQQTQNPVDAFITKALSLSIRDYLQWYLPGLESSNIFKKISANVPQINSQEDYDRFVKSLPRPKEVAAEVIEQIRTEYATLETRIKEVEEQRRTALVNPQIEQGNFFRDITEAVRTRVGKILVGVPPAKNEEEFKLQEKSFVKTISEDLEAKLKITGPNNLRFGDEIRVVNAMGLVIEDDDKPVFYYSGDTTDIPLGTIGEITTFDSPQRVTARFTRDNKPLEWKLHPEEIRTTGKNVYRDLVTKTGGTRAAAETVLTDIREQILQRYQETARQNINRVFDAKVLEVTSSLKRKFNINDKELVELTKTGKIMYTVAPKGAAPDMQELFSKLSKLFSLTLEYETEMRPARDNEARDEKSLKRDIANALKDTARANPSLDKVMQIATSVLERQYRATARLEEIYPAIRLDYALAFLLNRQNRTAVRRKMMYNDPVLFIKEPFAPPSESQDHVIILQAEYGCTHKCTYCTGNETRLTVRTPTEFEAHVKKVKAKLDGDFRGIRRAFIDGGNFFRHPTDKLLQYLEIVNEEFDGHTERIAAYTRTEGLRDKTVNDLNKIARNGLSIVYWGIETGSDALLEYVNKKTSFDEMVQAGEKLRKSEMQASVMIMPGLGGLRFYEDHVRQTARLINKVMPKFITFLTINPEPTARYVPIMAKEVAEGTNMPLTNEMVAEQMYDMVRLMHDNYNCLAAAYKAPHDKVGKNPVEFRARWQNGDRTGVLRTIEQYFTNGISPSPLIPTTDFNRDSPLRRMAAGK